MRLSDEQEKELRRIVKSQSFSVASVDAIRSVLAERAELVAIAEAAQADRLVGPCMHVPPGNDDGMPCADCLVEISRKGKALAVALDAYFGSAALSRLEQTK